MLVADAVNQKSVSEAVDEIRQQQQSMKDSLMSMKAESLSQVAELQGIYQGLGMAVVILEAERQLEDANVSVQSV